MIALKILENLGLYKPVDYDHKRFDRLAARLESPIEKIFWSAGYFELSKYGQLTPQVNIEHYRLDFALIGNGFRVAIELDGHDYHSEKAQMTRDYQRQRRLQACGWTVIRFTGQEIYGDVQGCIADVVRLVRGLS
jgi:very-short-patch-repair endonuclease